MERTPAARARGITQHHGDVVALDGVDLDVEPGRVHGLLGPNGAGKTTLLGLLLGVATPDGGTLEVLGQRVGRSLGVPAGVAGFVDGPGLYPSLTARQNLAALASLHGLGSGPGRSRAERRRGREDRVAEVLDEVGLSEVADTRVRGYSLGMRQRLGLAAALLARPRLLVLDEPANGLDPAGTRHVQGVVHRLAAEGVAVVLSGHRMDDLAALCDDATILSTGRVVFTGPLEKLAHEGGPVDHRLVTDDDARARALLADVPGLRLVRPDVLRRRETGLVLRGPLGAVDEAVARLVADGVAVRELVPVVTPLEAAFTALTGGDDEPTDEDGQDDQDGRPDQPGQPGQDAQVLEVGRGGPDHQRPDTADTPDTPDEAEDADEPDGPADPHDPDLDQDRQEEPW